MFTVETLANGYKAVRKAPVVAVIARVVGSRCFVFLRHDRPVVGKTLLEIPAGHIEDGENPGDAAKREFFEETELPVELDHVIFDGYMSPGFTDEHIVLYLGVVDQSLSSCVKCSPRVSFLPLENLELCGLEDMKTALAVSYAKALRWPK